MQPGGFVLATAHIGHARPQPTSEPRIHHDVSISSGRRRSIVAAQQFIQDSRPLRQHFFVTHFAGEDLKPRPRTGKSPFATVTWLPCNATGHGKEAAR